VSARSQTRARVGALTDRDVDRAFAVLAGWLMTGVYLDAWAHISRLPDSFWTPWHAILYSGLLACGVFLFVVRGTSYRALLGRGYDLSLVGFVIATLGGVADAIWHTVFGIEFDVEAAVSPSHLAIAFGILLVVTGPARAAWTRRLFGLPAALSLLYGLSILTIILDYANPFSALFGAGAVPPTHELVQLQQTVALFAFSAYAALLTGVTVIAVRSDARAAPWLALVVAGNAVALTLVNAPLHREAVPLLLVVALVPAASILATAAWLRPSARRVGALRAFATLIPVAVYGAYVIAISVGVGTWWSPTFSTGVIALSAMTALLVTGIGLLGRPEDAAA
jgi:hypothetical protein